MGLSPTFRVREFEVQDIYPFSIHFQWDAAPGTDETAASSEVFKKDNLVPSTKLLTFYREGTFALSCEYGESSSLPPGVAHAIAAFHVGPIPPAKDGGKA